MLDLILLVFAFVLCCISTFQPEPAPNRVRLMGLAFAFFFAARIFGNRVISSRIGGQ